MEGGDLALLGAIEVRAADRRDPVARGEGVAAEGQVARGGEQPAQLWREAALDGGAADGEVAEALVLVEGAGVVGLDVREQAARLVERAQQPLGRRRVRRAQRDQRTEGGTSLGAELAQIGAGDPASDGVRDELDRLAGVLLLLGCTLLLAVVKAVAAATTVPPLRTAST